MANPQTTAKRAPNSVVTDKPIPVRLMPDEREQFVAKAKGESRSTAAFTRLMALRGFEVTYKTEAKGAATPTATTTSN